MSNDDAAMQPSRFRRYWSFALRLVFGLVLTAWLGAVVIKVDVALGIGVILVMLQTTVGNDLLGLVSRSYQQQLIDTKELTRRMWLGVSAQAAVVLTTAVVLLFSTIPLLALLALLYLPVKAFLAIKLYRSYRQEPSGQCYRKGIFD